MLASGFSTPGRRGLAGLLLLVLLLALLPSLSAQPFGVGGTIGLGTGGSGGSGPPPGMGDEGDPGTPGDGSGPPGGGRRGSGPGSGPGDIPFDREPTLSYPVGEEFKLGADSNVGKIHTVVISRYLILGEIPPRPPDGLYVRLVGRSPGITHVTLLGEANARDGKRAFKTYRIRILPNIVFINEQLRRQFPLSKVRVSPGGDNLLIAEGQVETPAESDGILAFLRTFLDARGTVVNSLSIIGGSQVQLEVVIARVDRLALRRLAVNSVYAGTDGLAGYQIGNLLTAPALRDRNPPLPVLNPPGINADATVFWGVSRPGYNIFGFIEALRQQGQAKILATPTLVTLNGRPADFLVGGEQPFPVVNAASLTSGIASVQFKPFGTRLTFVPILLGQGRIRVDVVPEVSRPTADVITVSGISVPRFDTQRIRATVEMESGQTLVLGGLLQTVEEATVFKIPFFGDLPCIGTLFRRIRHEQRETELLVLATPRLVEPLASSQRPNLLPGQESRSPNDNELFFHGMIEAPLQRPPVMPVPSGAAPGYGPLPFGPSGSPEEKKDTTLPPPRPVTSQPGGASIYRGLRGDEASRQGGTPQWWPIDGPLGRTGRAEEVIPAGGRILDYRWFTQPGW